MDAAGTPVTSYSTSHSGGHHCTGGAVRRGLSRNTRRNVHFCRRIRNANDQCRADGPRRIRGLRGRHLPHECHERESDWGSFRYVVRRYWNRAFEDVHFPQLFCERHGYRNDNREPGRGSGSFPTSNDDGARVRAAVPPDATQQVQRVSRAAQWISLNNNFAGFASDERPHSGCL